MKKCIFSALFLCLSHLNIYSMQASTQDESRRQLMISLCSSKHRQHIQTKKRIKQIRYQERNRQRKQKYYTPSDTCY